jgi:hypothetical protein
LVAVTWTRMAAFLSAAVVLTRSTMFSDETLVESGGPWRSCQDSGTTLETECASIVRLVCADGTRVARRQTI